MGLIEVIVRIFGSNTNRFLYRTIYYARKQYYIALERSLDAEFWAS